VVIHSFIDSYIPFLGELNFLFIGICRANCVDNVASEELEAVARWSVIGKVVTFKLHLKLPSEGDCSV